MRKRLTLIVRLQRDPTARDWCGQLEMVDPHREAVFRDRRELWALLEEWTAQSGSQAALARERRATALDAAHMDGCEQSRE